jgi:hypothetical protein
MFVILLSQAFVAQGQSALRRRVKIT